MPNAANNRSSKTRGKKSRSVARAILTGRHAIVDVAPVDVMKQPVGRRAWHLLGQQRAEHERRVNLLVVSAHAKARRSSDVRSSRPSTNAASRAPTASSRLTQCISTCMRVHCQPSVFDLLYALPGCDTNIREHCESYNNCKTSSFLCTTFVRNHKSVQSMCMPTNQLRSTDDWDRSCVANRTQRPLWP